MTELYAVKLVGVPGAFNGASHGSSGHSRHVMKVPRNQILEGTAFPTTANFFFMSEI